MQNSICTNVISFKGGATVDRAKPRNDPFVIELTIRDIDIARGNQTSSSSTVGKSKVLDEFDSWAGLDREASGATVPDPIRSGVLSGRLISDDFIVISVTVLRSYPVLGCTSSGIVLALALLSTKHFLHSFNAGRLDY
ncbi:hypothetical protein F2Q69_00044181 [Brassica cretica]|uniref:Uncharacterized protein n=1 Tax=Brassica cretica TaxID=69181 RepID=A0A8S9NIM3_BRACR|nr:hypothetical protein F2Q69_00044181 [Brassica cretica]